MRRRFTVSQSEFVRVQKEYSLNGPAEDFSNRLRIITSPFFNHFICVTLYALIFEEEEKYEDDEKCERCSLIRKVAMLVIVVVDCAYFQVNWLSHFSFFFSY